MKSNKLSRLPRLVGADNDEIQFVTPSWSTPGLEYSLTISKRDGLVRCDCLGTVCHHKQFHLIDLLSGKGNPCKHVRSLLVAYRYLLGGE
jgi:hypothetical protein